MKACSNTINKTYLFIGLSIIFVTNLAILSSVMYNRSQPASAQLTLSERELRLPYWNGMQQDNSGIAMRFEWRMPSQEQESMHSQVTKLSEEKLIKLGFDPDKVRKHGYSTLSRELFWVLEFNGSYYHADLEGAHSRAKKSAMRFQKYPTDQNKTRHEQHQRELEHVQKLSSRLFVIQASNDYPKLVTQHKGKSNIVIAKGLNRAEYNEIEKAFFLRFIRLSVNSVMLPSGLAETFAKNSQKPADINNNNYSVNIYWGKRLEPWIKDVKVPER